LNGTESQGIAYMEILSSGIPCYVFNRNIFSYKSYSCLASSVPYFSEECGIISDDLDFNKFDDFLNKIDLFNPRKYILENHTLEISARNYIRLLLRNNLE